MTKHAPENPKKKIIYSSMKRLRLHSYAHELEEEILPKLINGTSKEKKDAKEKLEKREAQYLRALESETHVASMESLDEKYYGWLQQLTEKTIQEYGCTTELEKSLASLMASFHIRIVDNSKRLNDLLNSLYSPNKNEIHYLEILSRQIERAHRQFLSTVITLKQLKSPKVEMNIKTMTAFVSQNQQINVDKKNNEA